MRISDWSSDVCSSDLEGQHHLVDRWRADAELALHVCLGRRPAGDTGIGVDEGEILPLLVGEAALRRRHCLNDRFILTSPDAEAAMNIRYLVDLSEDERGELRAMLSGGKHAVRKLKRAQILLAADAGPAGETIEIGR